MSDCVRPQVNVAHTHREFLKCYKGKNSNQKYNSLAMYRKLIAEQRLLHLMQLTVIQTILIVNVNSQRSAFDPHNVTRIPAGEHLYVDNDTSATTAADSVANHLMTSNVSTVAEGVATVRANSDRNVAKCGNTQKMADNCFRDLPPHLMEFLQTSKIAINEQEITSKCNVFQRGMKCFDEYTARCIPQNSVNILKNNVEGARKFFTKFCEDKTFQNDYLSHKECFTYIQEDWIHCTKQFQTILTDGLQSKANFTDKFMEFCCARYAYETCIYNSARYKCYTNSAAFARNTAKMLSDEKHFSNCRQYEKSLCNSGGATGCSLWTLWLNMLLMLMLRVPCRSRQSD